MTEQIPACPTAVKRRYATSAAAIRDAAGLLFVADGVVLRAYLCRCGWWHLTHRRGTRLAGEGHHDGKWA
jgi:hypothetical protein